MKDFLNKYGIWILLGVIAYFIWKNHKAKKPQPTLASGDTLIPTVSDPRPFAPGNGNGNGSGSGPGRSVGGNTLNGTMSRVMAGPILPKKDDLFSAGPILPKKDDLYSNWQF